MSWEVNAVVERQDIMNQFMTRLQNAILSGSFTTIENPNKYINIQLLGSLSEFTPPDGAIGESMKMINGPGTGYRTLYGGLTYMAKLLLKVGTFSYLKEDRGREGTVAASGKCIFSNQIVLQCFRHSDITQLPINPTMDLVHTWQPIKFSSVSKLIDDCIAMYAAAPKLKLTIMDSRCHADCHTNSVYSECHQNYFHKGSAADYPSKIPNTPGCYINGPYVYGDATWAHWNTCHGPKHRNSGTNVYTCHENYSRLSLTNDYGGCNTIELGGGRNVSQ